MHVALIWPKSTFLIEPMYYPPLGLWYVWRALEGAGHSVEYFDLSEDTLPAKSKGFDSFWVSGTTPQADQLRGLGDELTSRGGQTVLGGPHAWLSGKEMLPYYDVVVNGAVFTADRAQQVLDVPDGYLQVDRLDTLDRIGTPVRSSAWRYKATLQGRRCTTAMTSLGCPYRCAFCSSPDLWGKVRYVPLKIVQQDIEEIAELGYGAVQFYDDILPIHPQRALVIAGTLKKHDLIWRCFMRSDLGVKHGKSFLATLAHTGLVEVLVGVESASQRIKDGVNKGTTVEQDTLLRKWCREVGISFKASLILGLPGETRETMEMTRNWLLVNRPDRLDLNVLVPMPGTPLYDHRDKYDCCWAGSGASWFKGKTPRSSVSTQALTADEILTFRNETVAELGIPY